MQKTDVYFDFTSTSLYCGCRCSFECINTDEFQYEKKLPHVLSVDLWSVLHRGPFTVTLFSIPSHIKLVHIKS